PLGVFGFGHLKTSPNWGEVPFLCLKILVYQGLRLMQNAQIKGISGICIYNDLLTEWIWIVILF
ncbi:hypothetical protein, partial [Paenibacillus lactis]|uniref:hypothetical protein n=1 Tax=Paenibacillus lactis TaxID=228574 RepID=UPI0039EE49C2